MLLRQHSTPPLPERDPGVHEYRAALLSVFLHTDPRGDPSSALTPAMQPLLLSRAITQLQDLPDRYRERAMAHAKFKLASTLYIEGREEFRGSLSALVGGPDKVREFERRIGIVNPNDFSIPTYETVRQAVYADGESFGQGLTSEGDQSERQVQARALSASTAAQRAGTPESNLNLETLTTTVTIESTSNLPFSELASTLDPRHWCRSPFWVESQQVVQEANGFDFKRPEPGSPQIAIGNNWEGFLFEQVEWNWNTTTVSSFSNLLRINFQVDEATPTITLGFTLYSCEGSQLYAQVSSRGVDVDCGRQKVSGTARRMALTTQKNIRFADTLNRRTPFEGPAGSGQLLSYLAPAIVGLWMLDLLGDLHASQPSGIPPQKGCI